MDEKEPAQQLNTEHLLVKYVQSLIKFLIICFYIYIFFHCSLYMRTKLHATDAFHVGDIVDWLNL